MTRRTFRIRKYMLCFKKILLKKKYFSCDFKIFDGTIGWATKFHAMRYKKFFSIVGRLKVISVFVKNLPKLNILSVIANDLVKIFKQTKNHLAHFIKV